MNDLLRRRRVMMGQKVELEGPVFQITDFAFQSSYYDTNVKLVDAESTGWTIFMECEDLYAKSNRQLIDAIFGWYDTYWYWGRTHACTGISFTGESDYIQNRDRYWVKSVILRANLMNNTFKVIVNGTWSRSYTIKSSQVSTQNVRIGPSSGYDGTVKDFRIWKRPLSDKEIDSLLD